MRARIAVLAIKIVDDIKRTDMRAYHEQFLSNFNARFKFGTVSRGPVKMRFFGLNSNQDENMFIGNDCYKKLFVSSEYPVSRAQRKSYEDQMNDIERAALSSLNSLLSWIGTATSPIRSFSCKSHATECPKFESFP